MKENIDKIKMFQYKVLDYSTSMVRHIKFEDFLMMDEL